MNWLLTKVLGFAGRKLDGYRTKIGACGAILLGLCGGINIMFPATVPGVDLSLDQIIASVSCGFVALGIGGKIDKNTTAVKEAANGVPEAHGEAQRISSPAERAIKIDDP